MPRGWTADEWNAYRANVATSHDWYLQVRILDRAHQLVAVLPPTWISGQVNLDVSQDIDRTMQLTVVDRDGQIAALLDPDVALQHYIQIRQGSFVKSLGRVLWQAIFTGIPNVTSEQGGVYDITAAGKEALWLAPSTKYTIFKGQFVTEVIRNGLIAAGEKNRIDIPPTSVMGARVQRAVTMGGTNDVTYSRWKTWKRLAAAAGYQLYVDGAGYYVLRRYPAASHPLFEFDSATILSEPTFKVDLSSIRNRWQGKGAGTLSDYVGATGAFSGPTLAVGESKVPWYSTEFADQDTSLTTATKLVAAGKARLLRLITYSNSVDVDVIPVHAFEPLDMTRVTTPTKTMAFPVRTASIPFAAETTGQAEAGWPMSIGRVRNVRRGRTGRSHWSGKPPKKKR